MQFDLKHVAIRLSHMKHSHSAVFGSPHPDAANGLRGWLAAVGLALVCAHRLPAHVPADPG